ncbi:hypothetical protein NEHOM01_2470 [Nematocida homosporus]|uniref:uncharacterized protein n=1 Tax=Nematocida homosporus TaxID=1912981 RepID=UPI002220D5F9|nr:uncharacterized protein NEHOM01_2470 [Nematocida homosporus]KAI5187976.1 hypothetical protein NEHOM01_2470 [Nematocida homosporus]
MIVIDYFTRYVWAKITETKTPNKIITFLEDVLKEMKFKKIISDREREFENAKIEEWIKDKGLEHYLRLPYHHKGTGRAERVTSWY